MVIGSHNVPYVNWRARYASIRGPIFPGKRARARALQATFRLMMGLDKSPVFGHHHGVDKLTVVGFAKLSPRRIRYLVWRCPNCQQDNRSRVPPALVAKQSRCGRCHRGYWVTTSEDLRALGQTSFIPGPAPCSAGAKT